MSGPSTPHSAEAPRGTASPHSRSSRDFGRGDSGSAWKAWRVTWTLPQPMLTTPTTRPDLPPGWAAEPKWDGYCAQLAHYRGGRVLLRSRRGTDMTPSFPEIQTAAAHSLGVL